MGKLHSKHECFLVSADLNKALEDQIWKKKTGFNLANYNMDESLSELSICLEEKPESSPLQVELPPQKLKTDTSKVLNFDHFGISSNHGNGITNTDKAKLNIEEFACGVQLEGSETAKQEWSFTLYDFDGHGRITKEDLSSVLKALYDAVGSSIKLPPNGARTLKLRLSVGQEPSSSSSAGPLNLKSSSSHHRNTNNNKVNKCKVKDFSKLNNLTRTHHLKCINEDKTMLTTNTHTNTTTTTTTTTNLLSELPPAPPPSSATNQIETQLLLGQSETVANAKTTNEIVSIPDHRKLADLVQENMERNRIKQLRRRSRNHSDGHHKRRHRSAGAGGLSLGLGASFGPSSTHCPVTSAISALTGGKTTTVLEETAVTGVEEKAKESQDRRNYYLDLAGVENTTSKFQNNPTVPLAGSGCVRTGSGSGGGGGQGHHRSRSHDIASKCDNHFRASGGVVGVSGRWDKCDNVRREHLNKQGNNVATSTSTGGGNVTGNGGAIGTVTITTTTTSTSKGNHQQHKNNPKSRLSFDPTLTTTAAKENDITVANANTTTTSCAIKSSPKSQSKKHKHSTTTTSAAGITLSSTKPITSVEAAAVAAAATSSGTKAGRFRPVSLPGHVPVLVSPSHYHRRHKHRDRDHSLAMQQVARWIEREHAWDMDGDRLVVQRHEHHHIHEHHHHHHYHHYYEA